MPASADMPMVLPETFRCARVNMTLTEKGCSRLWVSVNGDRRPESWEARASCVGCSIGRSNSGAPADPLSEVRAAIKQTCSRCLRASERLIWPERQAFCVSCDNRQREAIRGRNAKGNPPAIMYLLRSMALAFEAGDERQTIERPRVLSLTELVLLAVKSAHAQVTIAMPQVTDAATAEVERARSFIGARFSAHLKGRAPDVVALAFRWGAGALEMGAAGSFEADATVLPAAAVRQVPAVINVRHKLQTATSAIALLSVPPVYLARPQCRKGHAFSPANATIRHWHGRQYLTCKMCARERQRRRYSRRHPDHMPRSERSAQMPSQVMGEAYTADAAD
jgi:hypothetical protein